MTSDFGLDSTFLGVLMSTKMERIEFPIDFLLKTEVLRRVVFAINEVHRRYKLEQGLITR